MKNTLIIILLFCPALIFAQWTAKIGAGYFVGVESNILRNPGVYFNGTDTLTGSDLWKSAAYHSPELVFDLKFKKNKHIFRWENIGTARFHHGVAEGRLVNVESSLEYDYSFKKFNKLFVDFDFRIRNRGNEVNPDAIINTPNSYSQYYLHGGFKLKPNKLNRMTLRAGYRVKNYVPSETSHLHYHAVNLEMLSYHTIRGGKRKSQQLNFRAQIEDRFYRQMKFTSTPDEEEESGEEIEEGEEGDEEDGQLTTQHWMYITGKVGYVIPLNTKLSVIPSLEYIHRLDIGKGTASYGQLRPKVELKYKGEKTTFSIQTNYALRRFTTLTAKTTEVAEESPMLTFHYLRASGELEFNIGKGVSLGIESGLIKRFSNTSDVSTLALRDYWNFWAMAGIRWVFPGKK